MLQALNKRTEFLRVLRHRDFRVYYLGLLASVLAHHGMVAALGWLVFDMTGEPVMLGYVAAAQAVPAIVLNLLAGALADRFDPRRIIIVGEGIATVLMALLATLVLTEVVQVWHIIVIALFTGMAVSFDQPSRRVIWPVLVPRAEFVYAIVLNQSVWNGSRVIAPAFATGIIAVVGAVTGDFRLGAAFAFFAMSGGYALIIVAMLVINMPPLPRATGATVFHDIVDGLTFIAHNRIFLTLMGLSFAIGYFGLSYQYLLPAFAKDVLGRGPEALGFLLSASGLGGVTGLFVVASFAGHRNEARLMATGGSLLGVSVLLLGLTGELGIFPIALFLTYLAGLLFTTFQIGANTLVNLLVPTEYRGRVMGLRGISWSLSPLGALQAGFLAGIVTTPFAIAVGGAAVLVITVGVFSLNRQLRHVNDLVTQAEERDLHAASQAAAAQPGGSAPSG